MPGKNTLRSENSRTKPTRRMSGLMAFRATAKGVAALMKQMKDKVPEEVDVISHVAMPFILDDKNKIHRAAFHSFFRSVDVDNSGEISVPEFVNALKIIGNRLGRRFQRSDSMTLFSLLDVDSSGSITEEEMFHGMCRINDRQLLSLCYAVEACHHYSLGSKGKKDSCFKLLRESMDSEEGSRLKNEYERLLMSNKKLRADHQRSEAEKHELSEKANALEMKLIDMQKPLSIAPASVKTSNQIKHDTHKSEKNACQKCKDLLEKLKALETHKAKQDQRMREYEVKVKSRDSMLKSLKASHQNILLKSRRDRHEAARARKNSLGKYIGRRRSQVDTSDDEVDLSEEHVLKLEKELAVLKAHVTQLKPEVLALRQENEELLSWQKKHALEQEIQQGDLQNSLPMKIMQAKINEQAERIQKISSHQIKDKFSGSVSDPVVDEDLEKKLTAAHTKIDAISDINRKLLGKVDRLQVENIRVSFGFSAQAAIAYIC